MAKKKQTGKKEKQNKKGIFNYIKKEGDIRKVNWKVFAVCLIVVAAIAFIGSLFTDTGTWYESIKPSIAPPNYVFPIVWTILFYLIAVALYFSFLSLNKKKVAAYYGINFVLNVLWSYLFFGMKKPFFAFIEIIILWISILSLIIFNWKKCRKASYFLLPYLIWVSFALILNYLIIK